VAEGVRDQSDAQIPNARSAVRFRTRSLLPTPILYLEFGCGSGAGIKYWAEKCRRRDARFIGFDTFTGLPEAWQCVGGSVDAGIWSLNGVPPAVDDDRVSFEKGLFQATLPSFLAKSDIAAKWPFRVIHIDADLYSSTLFVLCGLLPFLDGAIVLFDEFDCVLDEFRALEDFCKAFRKRYSVLAVSDWCEKVAIQFEPLSTNGG